MTQIIPEAPTSDDQIEFQFSWGHGGHCAFAATKSIIDTHLYFDVSVAGPCAAVGMGYTRTWQVGRLHAGDYQITFSKQGAEVSTTGFAVAQGELPFPIPSIPSLGIPASVLLVLALAWFANKILNKEVGNADSS